MMFKVNDDLFVLFRFFLNLNNTKTMIYFHLDLIFSDPNRSALEIHKAFSGNIWYNFVVSEYIVGIKKAEYSYVRDWFIVLVCYWNSKPSQILVACHSNHLFLLSVHLWVNWGKSTSARGPARLFGRYTHLFHIFPHSFYTRKYEVKPSRTLWGLPGQKGFPCPPFLICRKKVSAT